MLILARGLPKGLQGRNNLSLLLWVSWSPGSQFHDFMLYDSLPPSIYVNELYVILMIRALSRLGDFLFFSLPGRFAFGTFQGRLLSWKAGLTRRLQRAHLIFCQQERQLCPNGRLFSLRRLSHAWHGWIWVCPITEFWLMRYEPLRRQDSFFPSSLHWSL